MENEKLYKNDNIGLFEILNYNNSEFKSSASQLPGLQCSLPGIATNNSVFT